MRIRSIMQRRTAGTLLVLAALVASMLIAPSPASAHERRAVAGKYTFVVGFLNEPAYVEDANGVSLAVTNAQSNEPVEGLEKTLKVEVTTGSTAKTFDLKTVFNKNGAYKAEFIPTKAGSYSFRFFGAVEGTQVNEKFDSGPGRFDDVQSKAAVEFPASVPTNGELAQQVQGRTTAPAEAAAQPGVTPADVQRALDRADSARTTGLVFGLIGTAFGLIGMGLAATALQARRKAGAAAGRGGSGDRVEPV